MCGLVVFFNINYFKVQEVTEQLQLCSSSQRARTALPCAWDPAEDGTVLTVAAEASVFSPSRE